MRVLWTAYGSRGTVQPREGLAAQLCAQDHEFLELPTPAAGLGAAQFDTVATGVMPAGGWR